MARIEIPGGTFAPGDVVEGTVEDAEGGTLELVVYREIVRPFSSEPDTRWIAHSATVELVRAGDRAAFSVTLPRLEELQDVPAQPRLARWLARLLRIEVTPLRWELGLERGGGAQATLPVQERRAA
jgi:hypothetical protein